MKALIISDSHHETKLLQKIIDFEYPFDYIFFCGDGLEGLFKVSYPGKCRVNAVSGNVDLYLQLKTPLQIVDKFEGKILFMCHGNRHNVKASLDSLIYDAHSKNADIVFFGHTHIQHYSVEGSLQIFNPGAVVLGSYGIAEIFDGLWTFHHRCFV